MTSWIKSADLQVGIALRWFANLITGNTFSRMSSESRKDARRAEAAALEARDIARRVHDTQQELLLATYKGKNG